MKKWMKVDEHWITLDEKVDEIILKKEFRF